MHPPASPLTTHHSPLTDKNFLLHALRLATRGLGRTMPNPSVGCVLVKNHQVIAAARTADSGRPHAEAIALAQAGIAARGATAYVSLEPCAHHGKTPPCAEALIQAGIARVVYGAADPDPRVAGKGAAMLQAAGIEVSLLTTHYSPLTEINAGFFRRIRHGMPFVTAKIATSADGWMTPQEGQSPWITGEQARAHGHLLRAQAEAILTGIGTVSVDDPMLNVRLPGLHHPALIRVVADSKLRLPITSKLVKSAEQQPVWVITTADAVEQNASHATELRERGVVIQVVEKAPLSPHSLLKLLGSQGINRLMLEAGPTLTASFLESRAVDQLYWYRAPMMLGNTGKSVSDALHSCLNGLAGARPRTTIALGDDRCDVYELEPCLPD